MTWLRRNWVDLLMVVLILAVIAGFLVLFLRGNGLKLFGSSPASDTNAFATSAALPAATSQAASGDTATSGAATSDTATADGTSATTSAPVAEAPIEAAPSNPVTVNDVPEAPATAASTATASAATPSTAASSTTTSSTTAPETTDAAPARPPTRDEYYGAYRISVGAYTSADRAARVAAQAHDATGEPLFAVPSRDDLSVVLAGPYATQADADAALAKLRARYPDAILYRPNRAAAPAPATTKPAATTVTPAPAPAQSAAGTKATGEPVYFQVGAYFNAASASPALERLRGSPYPVTLRTGEKYVRVIVGPVPRSELDRARADLESRGLKAFITR